MISIQITNVVAYNTGILYVCGARSTLKTPGHNENNLCYGKISILSVHVCLSLVVKSKKYIHVDF